MDTTRKPGAVAEPGEPRAQGDTAGLPAENGQTVQRSQATEKDIWWRETVEEAGEPELAHADAGRNLLGRLIHRS